ncbi:hypothetical protein [Salinarimonas chemoclinalis]|uniref:hypothetical protein n=1 Tax=Salinarimonas chemoclinalis TaxID=3241599 RepID=UPI00355825FF
MPTDQSVDATLRLTAAQGDAAQVMGADFRDTYGQVSLNQRLVDFHEANTTAVGNLVKSGADMAEQLVRA